MDKLRITGGRALHGEVVASGAKNAALPILCASLLTADALTLTNIPSLQDIRTTLKLLGLLGVTVAREAAGGDGGERVTLGAARITSTEAPYELVKTMRASILVLGPLLARFGEARVSLPGGCAIGQRPIDQHIKGLQAMGAEIAIEAGFVVARAKRLRGARIVTDMVSVTGTENLLMAACLADGETVIENAAREPEVSDLARALVAMGARIEGAGTDRIVVQGVERLHGAEHRVMADRILLVLGLRREIAREVDYQQSVIPTLHPSIRAQLMQLSQQRLNKVQAVWDNLAGPCQPVPFKNRTLRVTADVLYKDPMSGVGLMEAVNGVVNLANVPSWEIEGKVKTSKLIYRK